MKKLLLLFIALLTLAGTVHAQKGRISKKEQIAGAVARTMVNKRLVIYISNVMSEWGNQNYNPGLKVTLINDKFTCNLPYQGSSRINTYGSQDLYIKAEDVPVDVTSDFNDKKGFYEIKFNFTSSYDNEPFEVSMKIFVNGKVTMQVNSPKRSNMRYSGGLEL